VPRTIRRPAFATLAGLLAGLASLIGCRSGPEPAVAQRGAPLPPGLAASLPAQLPISVTDIELGRQLRRDKRVAQLTDRFGIRDTIYAVVSTTGQAANAVLTAIWTYRTGQLVDSTAQAVAPNGPALTEFHVFRKAPWPAGSYQVEIFLDSASAGIRHFTIVN
jgi:hypothetical protein